MRITENKLRSIIRSVIIEDASKKASSNLVMGRTARELLKVYGVEFNHDSFTLLIESNVEGKNMDNIFDTIRNCIKRNKGEVLKQDSSSCLVRFPFVDDNRDVIIPLQIAIDLNQELKAFSLMSQKV